MRNKITFFLFFFFSFFLYGQTETIPLKYSSKGYTDNTVFREFDGTDDLTPTVNGEMNVSSSGGLTYAIPIEVVKGVNNFQPNIVLTYNSQSGNGQAGWGWNITGSSSIMSGGKSKDVDGITIGPQFDGTDPYYLDGQRLIKVNDAEFVTEKFSKIKIYRQQGEFGFIVKYTDGKIAKYKELIPGQFYVSTFIDSFDNEIHYSYDVESNTPRIVKISYGGKDVASDRFFVDFIYKGRVKPAEVYRNGVTYTNSKILSEIRSGSAYLANQTYRQYILSHDLIEDNAVERLRSVRVKNEAQESLKPLKFSYNTSTDGYVSISQNSATSISFRTTGLGSVTLGDFVDSRDKIQSIYQERIDAGYGLSISSGSGSFSEVKTNSSTLLFSGKVLDEANRVTPKDQLIVVNEKRIGDADLSSPSAAVNSGLVDNIDFDIVNVVTGAKKTITVPVRGGIVSQEVFVRNDDPYDPYGGYSETNYLRNEERREYVQGDFNNDGLVDFLIIEGGDLVRGDRLYLVELGKMATGGSLIPTLINENINFYKKDIHPFEFNGDGLPEFMVVDKANKNYSVYRIDFSTKSFQNILPQRPLSNFTEETPLFFGDFNGDGLTDFLTPQKIFEIPTDDNSGAKMAETYFRMENEPLLWWKYVCSGKDFLAYKEDYTSQKIAYLKPSQSNYIKKSTFWQKFWNGKPDEYAYTRFSTNNIMVGDFNNDGRSDIITLNKVGSAKYNSDGRLYGVAVNNLPNVMIFYPRGSIQPTIFASNLANQLNFYENKSLQGGTFSRLASYPLENVTISPLSLMVSSTQFDNLNVSNTGVFIYDPLQAVTKNIAIDNGSFLEKQIQEIDNGSNVLQKIDYRNMTPSSDPAERTYLYNPYDDNFKYPIYIHKSNPVLYLVNKIHTVYNGRVLSKEYRFGNGIQNFNGKGFMGFQKIYSSDPYESEIRNGKYINKFPSRPLFWNIQTNDPEMENATLSSTYGALKDQFFTVSKVVNKRFDRGNHQYLILAIQEVSNDLLKKIVITKDYKYDEADDLKLKEVQTNYSNVGSSVSKYEYKPEFNNGDHYYYGKIASVENITYKDGYSFSTKEENSYYLNGEVQENKKYGNQPNAPPIVKSFTYDQYGNLKSETTSTEGITPLTTTYEYDATNRFVNKTTTPDGLSSASNVSVLGKVIDETSSIGNLKTYYAYDSWGNITEITDFLGKKTKISKSIADGSLPGAVYNLHKKREGGTETIVTFDRFDREIQTKTQSINGKWVAKRTEYDLFGRNIKESEPFFEGESPKWNEIEYDALNRPVKHTTFTGKKITTCYTGMKIVVDDGYKKTTKTLDAMGHVVKHQDHGGTITYAYYPNGSLRETNYEGSVTTFEIDGWGNKTKMNDPQTGESRYKYDNLGRILSEQDENGATEYTYDSLGRVATEKVIDYSDNDTTDIIKTYTYNGQTKLPETITGTNNGKTFTYTTLYDEYYRIKGKIEQTPEFVYKSTTTYDSYGRADEVTLVTQLFNPSYTSSSKIKNVYDANGILIQQNDNDTGKMIWHVSDVNSRGNTTQMEYGNGYKITNTYSDSNFTLQRINHFNPYNGISVQDISYEYDVDKGVLNKRNNAIFGKEEKFTYDNLNRLLTETVNNVLVNEYTYDNRGRLTSNTELGKYNYNSYDFRLQSINFNTNGKNVNAQRGFASAQYTPFKSPAWVTLEGKENLVFDYNILKTRYSMKSTVTGREKYYSSDFAVEITKDNTGRTQIVTYLTGDPYSANYIKKEVLIGVAVTEKGNFYLHRDNLQSIVAITKDDGTVIEKRFFDAWGNLKALVNQAGQMITDAGQLMNYDYFLDRGYTGHEHLWKAGLINMNARLYDPILRKFLSADNLVSDPYNTQSYDRYSYVLNNPLLYMDASGWEPISFTTALIIAIVVAVGTKVISNMISGIPWWYGVGKAATMGAISGAISFGIGAAATSAFGTLLTVGKAVFEATAHAITSGLMDAVQGIEGGSGFASGFVSSLLASGVSALGINFAASNADHVVYNGFGKDLMKATMIVTGGLGGGISATIAGGKFMDGFRQGLITAGLNHVAHLTTEFLQRIDPNNPSTWTRKYSLYRIKELYPRFYEVLTKLQAFLQTNPKVLSTLSEDTGLTKAQILKFMDIKSPEGQVIVEAQMKDLGQSGYPKSFINKELITTFETLQTPAYIQGTSFLLAITVLHEFVHWGRAYNILPSDSKGTKYSDYGSHWEDRTFGDVTGKNQATINLSYKYGWKF